MLFQRQFLASLPIGGETEAEAWSDVVVSQPVPLSDSLGVAAVKLVLCNYQKSGS